MHQSAGGMVSTEPEHHARLRFAFFLRSFVLAQEELLLEVATRVFLGGGNSPTQRIKYVAHLGLRLGSRLLDDLLDGTSEGTSIVIAASLRSPYFLQQGLCGLSLREPRRQRRQPFQ